MPIAFLFAGSLSLNSQTTCSAKHTRPGVFFCLPDPASDPSQRVLPEIFHLSAQTNSGKGATIGRYLVFLDGNLIFQNRLQPPQERLSLELNLKTQSLSGKHVLRLVVDGAGTAELRDLQFRHMGNLGLCDPTGGVQIRSCTPSALNEPLTWQPKTLNPATALVEWRDLYHRNLKSLEADTGDAAAVDTQGNLLLATHSLAAIELRKYSPNGSIIYDSVINTCQDPTLAISALAFDEAGRVWMAGNMSRSCLPASTGAWRSKFSGVPSEHGFVVLLNTATASQTTPVYATYLSEIEHHVSAIRVDAAGNAFLCGTAASNLFAHDKIFSIGGVQGKYGFVSVMDPAGSKVMSSALVEGAALNALALGDNGTAFVAGSSGGLFIAALANRGTLLRYYARLQLPEKAEGRAISVTSDEESVLIHGVYLPAGSNPASSPRSFVAVAGPCRGRPLSAFSGSVDEEVTFDGADQQILDAFSGTFNPASVVSPFRIRAVQTCPGHE